MTEGEKRIAIILINYSKGKYSLQYLKDVLARGLRHVDECGVTGVDRRFIHNLACVEAAIERIERAGGRHNKETNL
jgi:hypothetical protein